MRNCSSRSSSVIWASRHALARPKSSPRGIQACWASACTRSPLSMAKVCNKAGSKRRGPAPPRTVSMLIASPAAEAVPLRGQVPAGRYGSSIACDRQTRWNASRAGGILTPVCRQRGAFCLAWTKTCDAKLRIVVRHGPYPRGAPGSARQAEATSPAGGEMSRLRLRESDIGLAR